MATADSKLQMLRSVPLFKNLRQRDIDEVERLADVVDVPAGQVLMREGQTGNEMFVLVSGAATIHRAGRQLMQVGPGAVLGEMALISEGPRNATVTVTEPSSLVVIGHREFHTLLNDSPELLRSIFDSLGDRIRNLDDAACH
jgi:CRP-like cAMP-binding protein